MKSRCPTSGDRKTSMANNQSPSSYRGSCGCFPDEHKTTMSNNTPPLLASRNAVSRVAFSARVVFCALVVFVSAIFSHAVPRIGPVSSTESEAPVEEGKSFEEAAISVQSHTRVRRHQATSPLPIAMHCGTSLSTSTRSGPQSGHRLHNNLLAPLRC